MKGGQQAPSALRVVVADDHHHVLPEIHAAIRRRLVPFQGVHVLHFDAHPDLSFPRSVDPALVFEPHALYDALDESVSGIAEFLLPLVYAGHVNQLMWIKPQWATQMPIGLWKQAFVGKHQDTKRLCVSLPLLHFIEEDAYAAVDAMASETIKPWDFFITELPDRLPSVSTHAPSSAIVDGHDVLAQVRSQLQRKPAQAYILDIDLDYFSTWNPFRKDLEQRVGAATANIVAQVFTALRYRDMGNGMSIAARSQDRRSFVAALGQLEDQKATQANDPSVFDPSSLVYQSILNTLTPLYRDGVDAPDLLTKFMNLMGTLDHDARQLVWWAGPNLDLPHHMSSNDEIERMVAALRDFLVDIATTNGKSAHPPSLVTIAKSTGDEYLPPHQLEFVQSRVLRCLRDVFGDLDVEFVAYEDVQDAEDNANEE